MSKDEIPTAVREDTIEICGATFRVYVLDNGQRVVDADDVNNFFFKDSAEGVNLNGN